MLGLSIMIIVLGVQKYARPPKYQLLGNAVTFISIISYCLYLLHLFVFELFSYTSGNKWLLYICAFTASICLAWIFYETVEKAALALRNQIQSRWIGSLIVQPIIEAEIQKQL